METATVDLMAYGQHQKSLLKNLIYRLLPRQLPPIDKDIEQEMEMSVVPEGEAQPYSEFEHAPETAKLSPASSERLRRVTCPKRSSEGSTTAAAALLISVDPEDSANEPRYRPCLKHIAESKSFHRFFMIMNVVNSALVGVEEVYMVYNGTDTTPYFYSAILYAFTAAFIGEMVLRILAEGRSFFVCTNDGDGVWNYLDFVLVLLSMFESCVDLARILTTQNTKVIAEENSVTFQLVRILHFTRPLRVLRLSRVVRCVRSNTVALLYWSMLIFLITSYFFGVLYAETHQMHEFLLVDQNSPFEYFFTS